MVPYYFLIIYPIVVCLIQNGRRFRIGGDTRPDEPKGALVAFFVIFLGLLMCRGISCGIDLVNYRYYFTKFQGFEWQDIWSYDLDKGYILLNWVIGRFITNFQIFVAITAVFSVWPIFLFYKKEAESPILTMMLFVGVAPFSMYFSGLRQILAMALVYPMWYCAREKKVFRFLLLTLLAMTLHRSAFVMLLIYPLYHIRITSRWLIWVIPIIVLVYIFKKPILSLLIRVFLESRTSLSDTGATTVLILLILFAVYAYIIPDEKKLDADTVAMRNVLLLMVTIQCMAPIHETVMRMNYYFLPFIPVLIPRIAGRSKKNYYKLSNLSVLILSVFFCFYFFWNAHTDIDMLQVYPYIPFWSE